MNTPTFTFKTSTSIRYIFSFVNICFFEKQTASVNAECRRRRVQKHPQNSRSKGARKKFFFCMRFLVKSVNIGKLYFAIWSGSVQVQSPYNLAHRFKIYYIHPIVRFDTCNITLHLADQISGGCAVKPAVPKPHNKWSALGCRGVWRAGQKLKSRTKDWHFPVKPPP
jgi:hypothetical protein